jgi:uncharacterized protein YkwD
MQNKLRTFILGILALFSIYLYSFSEQHFSLNNKINIKEFPLLKTQQEEESALTYLNKLRVGAGLIPFTSHQQLKTAAQNHGDYLMINNAIGHFQDANKTQFTGMYASDRITHVGYATPLVIENVSSNNQNYKESVDGLFSAIYHRLAFLDFQSDEIGIGVKQNPQDRTKTAFVYDMSAKALNKLYREKNFKEPKKGYIKNSLLEKALSTHKDENSKIVTYPFANQTDIPAAFFDELPDPLPQHLVSGFPISVSFNKVHFKSVQLLNFKLFNSDGVAIDDTLIYDHKTDPNQRLNPFDFVLFPLSRLEWNSRYHVEFTAMVDGKEMNRSWSFQTRTFKEPLHRVTPQKNQFTVQQNESSIFYFPPNSKIDVLHSLTYPSSVDIDFIDKNTIKLTTLKSSKKPIILKVGVHRLELHTQPDNS